MDNILGELRQILDNNREFMGSEFLSVYSRLVFGKKTDPTVLKSASYLCKEFKSFIERVKDKQNTIGVTLITLDSLQQKMLQYVSKSFNNKSKVIDGDVALEKYKNFINNDVSISYEDKQKALSITTQEDLQLDVVNEIQTSFSNKKCMFNSLGQYEILKTFINSGYNECENWGEFVDKFHKLLGTALLDVQAYTYDAANSLDLSTMTIEDVVNNNNQVTKISTGYNMFDKVLQGGFQNQRVYQLVIIAITIG